MSKHMTIDLGDPTIRAMLGVDQPNPGGTRREVVRLAGDVPDPTGVSPNHRGIQSTHFLTGGKQEVVVVYADVLMTLDVYALPGEPVRVQMICPRCHKHSTITSDRKRIEYDAKALNPQAKWIHLLAGSVAELAAISVFGLLSIEPFECTWELGEDRHVAGGLHSGASLCRLKLVIDNNRAREA